jgi:hypothetical protein
MANAKNHTLTVFLRQIFWILADLATKSKKIAWIIIIRGRF